MLVKAGNPKGIKDYSSIKANADLKLAVMAGAVEVGYAKDAGIPQSQLVVLPDQSSLLAAALAGTAPAPRTLDVATPRHAAASQPVAA